MFTNSFDFLCYIQCWLHDKQSCEDHHQSTEITCDHMRYNFPLSTSINNTDRDFCTVPIAAHVDVDLGRNDFLCPGIPEDSLPIEKRFAVDSLGLFSSWCRILSGSADKEFRPLECLCKALTLDILYKQNNSQFNFQIS